MRNEIVRVTGCCILIAGLTFTLAWMHRFQYEHAGPNQVLVRINRFTGQVCFLKGDGWDSHLFSSKSEKDPFSEYGGYIVSGSGIAANKCE